MPRINRCSSIALLILLAGVFLCSCGSSAPIQSVKKESTYDRVTRTGKIRCGYIICPPFCIKEPNTGKLSGAGIEAMELVGKKLALKVDMCEEVGWTTALEGLQSSRYDIVATPLWANPDRAKLAEFSKPLCYDAVYAYVRRDDQRFRSDIKKLNSPLVTISTMDGEAGQLIAEADFPQSKRLSLPQTTDPSQLLLNVATRKADVCFCDPLFAYLFNKTNGNALEVLDASHPVRLYACCWTFKRGEMEFKAMLDTVLDEVINSGAWDRIIGKYEPVPNLVYRAALPYQAPNDAGQAPVPSHLVGGNLTVSH
jgi:polar amino acid transport system substrate-binding protein